MSTLVNQLSIEELRPIVVSYLREVDKGSTLVINQALHKGEGLVDVEFMLGRAEYLMGLKQDDADNGGQATIVALIDVLTGRDTSAINSWLSKCAVRYESLDVDKAKNAAGKQAISHYSSALPLLVGDYIRYQDVRSFEGLRKDKKRSLQTEEAKEEEISTVPRKMTEIFKKAEAKISGEDYADASDKKKAIYSEGLEVAKQLQALKHGDVVLTTICINLLDLHCMGTSIDVDAALREMETFKNTMAERIQKSESRADAAENSLLELRQQLSAKNVELVATAEVVVEANKELSLLRDYCAYNKDRKEDEEELVTYHAFLQK